MLGWYWISFLKQILFVVSKVKIRTICKHSLSTMDTIIINLVHNVDIFRSFCISKYSVAPPMQRKRKII